MKRLTAHVRPFAPLALALFLAVLLYLSLPARLTLMDRYGRTDRIPPVDRGSLEQGFVARQNNLSGIGLRVMTRPDRGAPSGILRVEVLDSSGRLIKQQLILNTSVRNGMYTPVDFPPVRQSKGRRYLLRVTPGGPGAKDIALFAGHSRENPEPLRLDGDAREGTLVFNTRYHASRLTALFGGLGGDSLPPAASAAALAALVLVSFVLCRFIALPAPKKPQDITQTEENT